MAAFTFAPRQDLVPVLNEPVADTTKSIAENLARTQGSSLVGNDLIFTSLYDFKLWPSTTTKGPAAPASPVDDQLWYDTATHILKYYNLSTTTWSTITWAKAREIFGFGVGGVIDSNRTYNVPADFATPLDAENYLRGYTITDGVSVTVNIAAGTYAHSTYMKGHPQGDQIYYVGAGYNSGAPVSGDFTITGNTLASVAADKTVNVNMLKAAYKVKINCTDTCLRPWRGDMINMTDVLLVGSNNGNGIDVRYGSTAAISGVSAVAFGHGIALYGSGYITSSNNSAVSNCLVGNVYNGVIAGAGGSASFYTNNFIAVNNGDGVTYGTGGVFAYNGGVLNCTNGYVCGNKGSGITAASGGSLSVGSATVEYNTGNGVYGFQHGVLVCVSSTVRLNAGHGLSAQSGSEISASGTVANSNTLNGVSVGDGSFVDINAGQTNNNTSNGIGVNNGSVNASGTAVKSNGAAGISFTGGYVDAVSADIQNNTTGGVIGTAGGIINANGATISNNAATGVSLTMSTANLTGASIRTNTGHGVNANSVSTVNVIGATIQANTGNGVFSQRGSGVDANSVICSGNTLTDLLAQNSGYINALTPVGGPTVSPAINVVGNNNSYIRG